MADTTQVPAPLSRTVFPFPKSRGANGQAGEANAQEYFQALSQAEDGFFPIGYNGQWHGGIHFGSQTGASLDQDGGIRCIADGQVIAYRIDREYPKVDYESCAAATYSRGFVLVRHRLQLPPAPQAAGEEAEATSNTSAEPSLVFYSLYMHLRNSEAYGADPCLRRPGFWDGSIHLVGERALDNSGNPFIPEGGMTGMNIRNEAHAIAGFAPRGVKLRLGEPHQTRGSYFRITEVVEGTTYPAEVVGMYVYKGTDTSREGLDAIASPHATDSVYIPPEPIDIKAGDIVGHLGEYQRYLDMDALAQCASGRPLAQVDVFTHEDLPAFVAQGRARDAQLEARQKTLLHIKPGARLVQPSPPDIELRDGQAIYQIGSDTDDQWVKGRRGTIAIVDERPAGFTTATRTYGDGRIFLAAVDAAGNEITLEQFNALHDRSTHPRRKLFTPQGDEVWVAGGQANGQSLITGPARAWSQFPLQPANADGEPVGYSRVLPVSDAGHVVREADGTRWFQVDAGTRSGAVLRGWVRESGHPNVELCSPWAWPGFELFEAGEIDPRDLFARQLHVEGRAQPQEQHEFEAPVRNVEDSALFRALVRAVDANDDQEITALELRKAMGNLSLAQAISRLVVRYPSEWSGSADRWTRIDDLIDDEVLRNDWQIEKGRIESLALWPGVAGQHGFPEAPDVHHFHPVGFIENFIGGSVCDCLTYRIISEDGTIERIMPKAERSRDGNIVRYIYVDSIGVEHEVGVLNFIAVRRVGRGNVPAEGTVRLVDLRTLENYEDGETRYGFHYDQRLTLRPYIADHALASLLGAMLDTGFVDVSCNGFSDHLGHSIGGSSSHRNGVNGDFKYFRLDGTTQLRSSLHIDKEPELMDERRQNSFNDALSKYGWSDLGGWRYEINGESRLLRHTRHLVGHHHHLHLQGYNPTIVEINE